jgi:hypothetical protein
MRGRGSRATRIHQTASDESNECGDGGGGQFFRQRLKNLQAKPVAEFSRRRLENLEVGTSPRHPGEQAAAQGKAMTGLTLDAGALIAFERNDPQVVALIVLADLIVV